MCFNQDLQQHGKETLSRANSFYSPVFFGRIHFSWIGEEMGREIGAQT